MAQHDYSIANQSGSAFRADLNNALSAIVTNNSGSSEPSTTYAYMRWADTTAGVMKMRNGANNAWITLYQLDGEWSTLAVENGSAAAPSIYFKDSGTDTGFYSPAANEVAVATNGTGRLFVNSTGSVGIGNSSPSGLLDLAGTKNLSSDIGQIIVRDSASYATGVGGAVVLAGKYNSGGSYTAGAYLNARKENSTDGNYSFALGFGTIANGGAISEKMTLDSSGRLGIGTTSPVSTLNVSVADGGNVTISNTNDGHTGGLAFGDTSSNLSGRISYDHFNNSMRFDTAGSERARIDSSGRLLVGTSSSFSAGASAQYGKFQVVGNSFSASTQAIVAIGRGQAAGASITSGSAIGTLVFSDSTGGEFAQIACEADAATGTNDYPGRLVFSTTADGASSPTERMVVKNNGYIGIGVSNPTINYSDDTGVQLISAGVYKGSGLFNASGQPSLYVNRKASDGGLVSFAQDGTEEGSISVSGTTVSYNGAHLSRWSQLPSGAERTEILRGSVLSNLDEMCEWGDEDNEQLNRMKVSDVEGDKNVSGVFQAWDDDDDTYTNDFYCAMTGDFIIRIAEGVTVERGDLLMSAGDGTAKPQDDDIIRSKTIAKVTSTTVSCTYEDGSYCVPCVLMAC